MKSLVLIIDNDLVFREALRDGLLQAGFYAYVANAGSSVLPVLQRLKPDALLISADLADGAAFSQVSHLRQDVQGGSLPIIMYSASAELSDKARGLDVGADDFVSKLFAVEDIAARIHGLSRRSGGDDNGDVVEVGGLRIDISGYSVSYEGKSIDLSRTLFNVLHLLVRQPDRVFTREQIRDAVWGQSAEIHERSVDVYLNRLRLSMGSEARNMIKTVRGIGYKLSTNKPVRNLLPRNAGYEERATSSF
jgi:DNA-binding response OmpR family regulator